MPSYVLNNITTSYQLLVDINTVPQIGRKCMHVQNQSQTIVWVRIGDENQDGAQELAFLFNMAIAFDFLNLKNHIRNIYVKAEAPVTQPRVILTFW